MPRTVNNPSHLDILMPVLQQLLPVGTVLDQVAQANSSTGSARIYIEDEATLINNGFFPACLLEPGQEIYKIGGGHVFDGDAIVNVWYYDRYDNQPNTIVSIRQAQRMDLRRMGSNIESNNILAYNGQAYAVSVTPILFAGTEKIPETKEVLGMTVVQTMMQLSIHVFSYGV